VTNTTNRDTPITQRTNPLPFIYSGVGEKRTRPSGPLPSTSDPQCTNTSSSSNLDKNKKKRQKHQSQDKKDSVTTKKLPKNKKSPTPVIAKTNSDTHQSITAGFNMAQEAGITSFTE